MLPPEMLKNGVIINIARYRGEIEGFTGKVVAIRDTHATPVAGETHRDRRMTRSQYLVTLEAVGPVPEGERKFRSYYHAFVETTKSHVTEGLQSRKGRQ